jgi:hypothetical protein
MSCDALGGRFHRASRRAALWVPTIVLPYATWAYSWSRLPGLSRRRTRIAITAQVYAGARQADSG